MSNYLQRAAPLPPTIRQTPPDVPITALVSVEVDELFGLYTYVLDASELGDAVPRLLILYGDNGSGKTTLLQLIYHLLSREDNRGHRTFLVGVPFRRLAVRLSDATVVSAHRTGERLTGSYMLRVAREGTQVFEAFAAVDENNVIRSEHQSDADKKAWLRVIRAIAALDLNLYYLPDDRRLESPFSTAQDEPQLRLSLDEELVLRRRVALMSGEFPVVPPNPLESALRRTTEWVRSEALRGSNIGQANANTIYATILQQILRSRGARSKNRSDDLAAELRGLEERSRLFSSFGLTSELNISELSVALHSASEGKRDVMEDVLRPYIDGLKARLDAMQRLQALLSSFLDALNSFFTNKQVRFTITEGFQIVSRNGEILAPAALSSGEKQLLLLFCNVIAAKSQAALFLLDEPELSLNIKWQRKLLQTLLQLIGESPVQLLVATHSLELLSSYRSHVLRLSDVRS